jgi:hypothetical protein
VPLTLLLAGAVFKHQDERPHVWPAHFGSAGSILIVVMIVSLGLPLHISGWAVGGAAALVLALTRRVAKLAGALALGPLSGLSLRQNAALGLALGPMSGLAWLLMHDAAASLPEAEALLAPLILCTIAIEHLVAPILVTAALRWVREAQPESGR